MKCGKLLAEPKELIKNTERGTKDSG